MSYRSKRELLAQVAHRYQQASHVQKSVILDEFVAATGYARKYAIRLLTRPPLPAPPQIRRPRAPLYGSAVQSTPETALLCILSSFCENTASIQTVLPHRAPIFIEIQMDRVWLSRWCSIS